MKKVTVNLKDKDGIRVIEIDPEKKYVVLIKPELVDHLLLAKELQEVFPNAPIFVLQDFNDIDFRDRELFKQELTDKIYLK